MRREAWSRGDVGRHFASKIERLVGRICQKRNDEILERDYPNLQLYQLGIGQRRREGLRVGWHQVSLQTAWARATLAFPPLQRHLTQT